MRKIHHLIKRRGAYGGLPKAIASRTPDAERNSQGILDVLYETR